jgi:uncharacterized protein YbgA (DUF1722 family)
VTGRFPGKPVEDEGRLDNFLVREHFLTRLFALARFRSVKAGSPGALVDYHTRHKYLLMAYSQSQLKLLGNVVAGSAGKNPDEVFSRYEAHLEAALSKPPRPGPLINVLLRAYGGMSEKLAPGERRYFLNCLEEYRDERIPLSVPLHLLKAWAVRLENRYLLGQTLLRPYPLELVEVADSGKGRDY